MSHSFSCLICGEPLTSASASAEHVIPNALGGRLATTHATCVKCNSSAGHGTDARLIAQFQLLANALDVIRDRGDHPEAAFIDPRTGQEYRMAAGKAPLRVPDIKVERSGATIAYQFNAPTREAAERLLKRMLPKGPHTVSDLVGTVQPTEDFTFELGYSAHDEALLRSIARIAVNFARHAGIPIGSSEPAVRYARGEDVRTCPVGPPQSDVVSIAGLPEHPLYHGVFVARPSHTDPLFAYVVLFQFCEFLVEIGAECVASPFQASYQQNLVTGYVEERPFEWILNTRQAHEWISARVIPPERMQTRFAPLGYYLSHRERLWIDRALGIGMKAYFDLRERGAAGAQASDEALGRANRVLSQYGMSIQSLEINESGGVCCQHHFLPECRGAWHLVRFVLLTGRPPDIS